MSFIEYFTKLENQLVHLRYNEEDAETREAIRILLYGLITKLTDGFIRKNEQLMHNLWLVLETYYRDKCDNLVEDSVFDTFEAKLQRNSLEWLGMENNPLARVSLWKDSEIQGRKKQKGVQ